MTQIFKLAFRDLGRNRRRSFFSALALAIGLALLMLMSSFLRGEMANALNTTIRLNSGHLQIRAASYEESKTSLKWEYLVADPDLLAAQISALPQVKAATPRLFAAGIAAVGNQTAGVRVIGIDPLSEASSLYREGLLSGEFLTPDDREGLLIGVSLAEKLNLKAGDTLNLSVNTANGEVDEQVFTVRGIYTTDTTGFDSLMVFLPLAKAQAFTRTEGHASTIFVLLHDKEQAEAVAGAVQTPGYQTLTWKDLNALVIQTEQFAGAYMSLLYLIVLGMTATVIVNTLIMAFFERTREIGILSAIGMRGGRIMAIFFAESALLAVGGIVMGLILGGLLVSYLSQNGFYIGDMGLGTGSMMMTNTIYALPDLGDFVYLTCLTFIITLLAGLYPAVLASRMEPVDALRSGL